MNSRTRFKKWAIRGLALGLSLLVATTALVAESRGLPAAPRLRVRRSGKWCQRPTTASTQNNVLNAVSCVGYIRVHGCRRALERNELSDPRGVLGGGPGGPGGPSGPSPPRHAFFGPF